MGNRLNKNGPVTQRRLNDFVNKLEEAILRTRLDQDHQEPLSDLLRKNLELARFLNEELGVIAGLFGIADERNDRYVTLQASRFQNNTDFEAVEIPRVSIFDSNGTEVAPDLLDFLFMVYRRDRQLSQGPPEFLTSAIRAVEARKGRAVPRPPEFPSRETEVSLNEDDSNILLYVEASEILLFLYAWRWFLRHAQVHGLNSQPNPDEELIIASRPSSNYWTEEFWSESGFTEEQKQTFPELQLVRALKEYAEEVVKLRNEGKGDGSRAVFLNNSMHWWSRIAKNIDEPTGKSFSHEWRLLGLLDQDDLGTHALSAMLRFAANELTHLPNVPKETISLAEALNRRVVGVSYSQLVDSGIESALRRAVVFLLSQSTVDNTRDGDIQIWSLIARLHQLARFLVIPYFYQVSLVQISLDHLVLGVWNSFDHQLTWQEKGEEKKIPQVVHAIVGIRATFGSRGDITSDRGAVLERIMPIHSFLKRMAQPLVDRGFYGKLIGRAQKEKGAIETGRAFGHQIKPIANMLTTEWVPPANELFNIRVCDERNLNGKVGSLVLSSEYAWLSDSLGVAPFLDLVSHAGDMMKLWAMTQTHADLPVTSDEGTVTFEDFLKGCLQYARNSLIPYAVVNKQVKDDLLSFRKLIQTFKGLLAKQDLSIKKPEALPAIGIQADNAGDSVWLSRIFTIIFQGCIEYGSLLQPIEVSIAHFDGGGGFQFVVTNTRRPSDREEIRNELTAAYQEELKAEAISEKQISDLIVCLNNMREGAKVITDRKTHSEGVLQYCLERLGGTLENWPGWTQRQTETSKAVTQFVCRYNLRAVEERKK